MTFEIWAGAALAILGFVLGVAVFVRWYLEIVCSDEWRQAWSVAQEQADRKEAEQRFTIAWNAGTLHEQNRPLDGQER